MFCTELKGRLLAMLLFICLVTAVPAQAREIITQIDGKTVSAEFIKGDADKPAIFVLHGFLQTRHYNTVRTLVNSLGDEGYTVLAPTLSLGISHRKQSLSCETPHTHTMEQDLAEITFWLDWLKQQGYAKPVLVGHSTGNIQLLALSQTRSQLSFGRLIMVSLIEYEREFGDAGKPDQKKLASHKASLGDTSLDEYVLSYCKKYVAPADAFLTYASWSREKILAEMKRLHSRVVVIVGGKDERMHDGWLGEMKKLSVSIKEIKGANHFFSSEHEFDLLDTILASINE